MTKTGNDSLLVRYQYNARNAPVRVYGDESAAFTTDASGNMTTVRNEATEFMRYDVLNRLVGHDSVVTSSTVHIGDGWKRFSHTVDGSATRFLYDGDNIVAEFSDAGTRFYVTPELDRPLSMTVARSSEAPTYYYLSDAVGNVRLLLDAGGGVVNRYDYEVFGKSYTRTTSVVLSQRYTFHGREAERNGKSMSFRHRTLRTGLGRFTTVDPLGYSGSPDGNLYGLSTAIRCCILIRWAWLAAPNRPDLELGSAAIIWGAPLSVSVCIMEKVRL